jgi:hypothetical protein
VSCCWSSAASTSRRRRHTCPVSGDHDARSEVDELEEGLQVAIEFHPTHKTSLVSIAEVITPPRKRD